VLKVMYLTGANSGFLRVLDFKFYENWGLLWDNILLTLLRNLRGRLRNG